MSYKITTAGLSGSDWVSFTPTGGWTTNTTYTGKWRRVGDSMEVQVFVSLSGAPNAANLTINLPSGYSIDTSKLSSGTGSQGHGYGIISDTGTRTYDCTPTYASTTSVTIQDLDDTVASNVVSNTSPFTFVASDFIDVKFIVPILGWSSNLLISNQDEARSVALEATAATCTGSIANTTLNDIIYGTTVRDTHGGYNNSTGVYTVPVTGQYAIAGSVAITGTYANNGSIYLYLLVNGTTKKIGHAVNASSSGATSVGISVGSIDLVAGDLVKLQSYPYNWTTVSFATFLESNFFNVTKISGSSQIASGDPVFAQYTGNGGTSITANTTNIDFTTKVTDNFGAFSGTVFTAPKAGWYNFTGNIFWTTSAARAIYMYINGTQKYYASQENGAQTTDGVGVGTYLNAGDAVSFRSDTTATLSNSATIHWLSISSQ